MKVLEPMTLSQKEVAGLLGLNPTSAKFRSVVTRPDFPQPFRFTPTSHPRYLTQEVKDWLKEFADKQRATEQRVMIRTRLA